MIVAVLLAVATIAMAYTNEELLQMKRTNPDRYNQVIKAPQAGTSLERAKAAAHGVPFAQARPGQGQIDRAGGPDGYGYIYKDETEVGGPTYSWIDTIGTTNTSITGDDSYGTIALPFTFTFYGNNCSYCYPAPTARWGSAAAPPPTATPRFQPPIFRPTICARTGTTCTSTAAPATSSTRPWGRPRTGSLSSSGTASTRSAIAIVWYSKSY